MTKKKQTNKKRIKNVKESGIHQTESKCGVLQATAVKLRNLGANGEGIIEFYDNKSMNFCRLQA